ncbi:MAG: xanthine dehydrogenase family protein molybdopterin-binding subunit [Nitrososphaerota archaeon]|jgi:carbon-monoxide dehydrogenase large subunit|nr:xanthine dehydrogenase family protein molybdopterin-binding subunit [Nitrososphaerota archaeon]MDG7037353.1 xanthine dehydrogenase family protein molybdopterin-binding subunit [Nitrososphaerota archaeon]MDG7039580.1 xanthine dehydrogenase family protein molybdopterin-binding subunit [Nitrososphaerota archaeon]MDG7045760.1 xanthine dehydrogenase family protein molybdopterin-binding subunit [Nitrososphaerota archaeon]
MSNKFVGKEVPQTDSWLKVTGTLKYAFDINFPGTLYAKLATSKLPHAKIKNIDVSEALKVKGVVTVVTGRDLPYRLGLYLSDRDVLAVDKVRWIGHPVAAVVADSLAAAEEAAERVSIEYEPLEPVLTVERALEKDSPLVHEKLGEYRVFPGFKPVPGTNIANVFELKHGEAEKVLEEQDIIIVEETYSLPQISHGAMETQNVLAWWRFDDYIELWTSIQSPFATRFLMADAMGLPVNRVIVHAPPSGGAFGLKAGLGWEPLVALLSRKVGHRPVKLILSRAEQMTIAPVRDGFIAKVRAGFKRDGRFIAYQADFYLDAGAYADYTVNVAKTAGYSADGAYDIPNVHIRSMAVYTNKIPTTAMRGFGHPENHWPLEQTIDRAARKLGMNPVEIRRINLVKPGESVRATGDRVRADEGDPQKVLSMLADAIALNHVEKPEEPWKVRAKGISLLVKAPSQPPNAGASAIVKFNEDGTVDVLTGNGSMGQGTPTSLAIIAAEEFGIPLERVKVNQLEMVNTDSNPYTWQTVGSRGLFSDGSALLKAIDDAKEQIRETASRVFKVPVEDVEVSGGYVSSRTHPWIKKEIREFAMGYTYPDGTTVGSAVIGRGSYAPVLNTFLDSDGQGSNTVFHTYGGTGVELEIDLLTGQVKVLKAIQVYDVGKAIDKLLIKGQMDGGFIMGLGAALYEELKFDKDGGVVNANFFDYYMPHFEDMTAEMESYTVETPQKDGPLGARGVGEQVMVGVAPAIANAIYNALGVSINELPITPEKLWKTIKDQKPELMERAAKSLYGEKIQGVSQI